MWFRKDEIMVISAEERNSAIRSPMAGGFAYPPVSQSGRQPSLPYFHIPEEVWEGIGAISKSVNSGAISEEEANDLIAALLSMWLATSVSQTVGGYLERDITQALMDIQSWGEKYGV